MTLVEPAAADVALATPGPDPAAIADEIGNVGVLKRKTKVRAFTDLPGVPAGTPGLVTLVNGWDAWIRYHVLFENGVSLGSVNRPHLVPAKQYDEMVEARTRALESGAFDQDEVAAEAAADGGEAAAGGGGGAVVNGVTIPQHLIERSAAARQRLGA